MKLTVLQHLLPTQNIVNVSFNHGKNWKFVFYQVFFILSRELWGVSREKRNIATRLIHCIKTQTKSKERGKNLFHTVSCITFKTILINGQKSAPNEGSAQVSSSSLSNSWKRKKQVLLYSSFFFLQYFWKNVGKSMLYSMLCTVNCSENMSKDLFLSESRQIRKRNGGGLEISEGEQCI